VIKLIQIVSPPFLYGAFAPSFFASAPSYSAVSTNAIIYRLLSPTGVFPRIPGHADIRDAARAHVLALTAPPTSSVGRKRILIANPYGSDFKGSIALIAAKRPELKDRLVDVDKAPSYPFTKLPIDFGRVEEVLGMKKDDFIKWDDTVLDTVDALIGVEKDWETKGFTVEDAFENVMAW
jgi:nucleoside-diphosphate-sugar epimerase